MCSPGLAHIRSFQFSYLFTHLFIHWPVEMSCGLRTLAALLEDHGLISSMNVELARRLLWLASLLRGFPCLHLLSAEMTCGAPHLSFHVGSEQDPNSAPQVCNVSTVSTESPPSLPDN